MATERYISFAHEPGRATQVLKPTVEWFIDKATSMGRFEAALVVPTRDDIAPLAVALGADEKALTAERELQLGFLSLTVYIKTDLPLHGHLDVPVLAAWCGDKLLEKVEELAPPLLAVVDWEDGWVERWVSNYGPTDIRSGESVGGASTIAAPEVLQELRVIDDGSNLTHPVDHRHAVNALKKLHAAGKLPDSDSLGAWAVGDKRMTAKNAKKLTDIADMLREGRTPRTR